MIFNKNIQKIFLTISVCFFCLFLIKITPVTAGENIFQDSLEEWGNWSSDSGVWEFGLPSSGPANAAEGSGCAGTILTGNYLPDTDSHLISPSILLPTLDNPWEQLILVFDNWYNYSSRDYGQVKIRVYNGSWSYWTNLDGKIQNKSESWITSKKNINKYAGSKIQIGFYHSADSNYEDGEEAGWYIDNLRVIKVSLPFYMPETFESGANGWYATQGLWEVGSPGAGPGSCHSGSMCAGTVLNGNYYPDTDSFFASPPVSLPDIEEGQEISLRFWHWFSYESRDQGEVHVREWNNSRLYWGSWYRLAYFEDDSGTWARAVLDITKYASSTVQIGFKHTADSSYEDGEKTGWYIDDVEIAPPQGFPPLIQEFKADKSDGFTPLSVSFSVETKDIDGSVVNYSWDFDGDELVDETSSESTVTHIYGSQGFFKPKVIITDDTGKETSSDNLQIVVNNSDRVHLQNSFTVGDWTADAGYGDLEEDLTSLTGEEAEISLGDGDNGDTLLLYQWKFDSDLETAPLAIFIRHKAETYFYNSSDYTLNIVLNPPDELDFWDDPVLRSSGGTLNKELENFLISFGPNTSYGGRTGVDTSVEGRNLNYASLEYPDEGEWVDTIVVTLKDGFYVSSKGENGFERESFTPYETDFISSVAIGVGDQAATHVVVDRVEVRGVTQIHKMRQSNWTVEPLQLDYETSVTQSTYPMAVLIQNSGTTDLELKSVDISGTDYSQFSLENDFTNEILAPGENLHVVVLFVPEEERTYSAVLNLESDAGSLTIPLKGTGSKETDNPANYSIVVLNSKGKDLHIVDPLTFKAWGGFLFGHLGRYDLMDIAVTSNGKRALVSAAGSGLFLLDFTNPANPEVINKFDFDSFKEMDIALTSDGRFAVVTGSNESYVGVVDLKAEAVVASYNLEEMLFNGARAAAVAIACDNQTILIADRYQSRVYVLMLNALGGLTYSGISLETGRSPSNIAIAPNGDTAIVLSQDEALATVLSIGSPGDVIKTEDITLPYKKNASAIFSPDSRRAYILSVESSPDTLLILDVLGVGSMRLASHEITLNTDATGTFYGVDSLVLSPDGYYAYVTNAYGGNPINNISVVDLKAATVFEEPSVGELPLGIGIIGANSQSDDNNLPPSCTVTTDKTGGFPPLEVNFSARAEDPDGEIKTYAWDFGDKTTGTGKNVTHSYNLPGQYTVLLTVSDDQGGLASDAILIRVGEEESTPLRVTPGSASLALSSELVMSVVGGKPPYEITANFGKVVPTRIENYGESFTYSALELGDDYVTVTDHSGQDISVRVRVTDQLGITPQGVNIGRGGTAEFRSIGGQPPYTWIASGGQLSRSQGSFNLYYAPEVEGEYQVTIRDATGREITASVQVVSDEIVLSPAVVTSIQGNSNGGVDFTVSGGTPPFEWRATSGSVRTVGDGNQTTYFTPEENGTYYLGVSDSAGRSAQAVIRVVHGLKVSPGQVNVDRGMTATFHVTGGASPFLWRTSNGDLSTFKGSSVVWIAPEVTGEHEIIVTDAFGIEAKVKAIVTGGLMVSPVLTAANSKEQIKLRAMMGVPPYTWPDGTEGSAYETVFDRLGKHEIIVRDSTGSSAIAVVEVVSDTVHIVPETAVVDPGEAKSLKVIGGKRPYNWTFTGGVLSATEGTIVTWISPEQPGLYKIIVEDSTGLTGSAGINVPGLLENSKNSAANVQVFSKIKINNSECHNTSLVADQDDDFDLNFQYTVPANKEGDLIIAAIAEISGSEPLILFRSEQGYEIFNPENPVLPIFKHCTGETDEVVDVSFYQGKLPFTGRLTFYLAWMQGDDLFLNSLSPFILDIQ